MSKVNPAVPLLIGADLYEALCLRVEDDIYKQLSPGIVLDDEGVPVTGDAIVDQWERDLVNGAERTQD